MKTVYFFNPGHEYAIANLSPYYMPTANMIQMQKDLAFLSAWYANTDDLVLLNVELSKEFENLILEHSIQLPKGIIESELIYQYPNSEIHLWGISPQSVQIFNSLNNKYSISLKVEKWHDQLKDLSSRLFAKSCLEYLVDQNPTIESDVIPLIMKSIEEIDEHIKNSPSSFVVKAPFSSAGKGLLWLPNTGLTRTENQIIHGMLKKQSSVSLEKVHSKVIDFAMEFTIEKETKQCIFSGYSLFKTTSKGVYECNYLTSQETILNKLSEHISIDILKKTQNNLIEFLTSKFEDIYCGTIGVDMMIYKNKDGISKLHPCLEINVRDNMGIIALNIYQKHINSNSKGFFYIDFDKNENGLKMKDTEMSRKYPLVCKDGKIKSGYLSLCPINNKTKYRAYILIE